MSAGERRPLRVALLNGGGGSAVGAWSLATALHEAGHDARVLTSSPGRARRLIERLLERREIDGPLTHLPLSVRALLGGDYDLAHAFSPPDALAALVWRRLSGRPVVLTCAEVLRRERLAHRRLRVRLLRAAVEGADAVIVPSEQAGAALERWLAVGGTVIPADDAEGHARLYRRLVT